MRNPSRHTEWLSLVEVSGPFLAVPVLEKAFPQGLDIVETPKRRRFRAAYEEWCDAIDEGDPLLSELHREWIRLVFTEILEYDGEVLKTEAEVVGAYTVTSPERTETFSPDWIVRGPNGGKPRLFVSIQSPGTDLEKVHKGDGWPTSLRDRMTALCRAHGVRLGLVTNGERWMLVNAPLGATSSDVSWYARLWFQEPVTLKAFQSLLGVRRCFGPPGETLEALLEKSLEHHEEVTDTLGEQVRRAVEVLIQCLDKADADRNRELLRDVSPTELYEAGLTVMMRLVFLLCAEERGLLLSGDPVYDQYYAISTLRAQLAEEADRHGPEVLDRRHDAWARLLAVFRAVHAGIEHETLRLPALGGSLFDPDRFPFLEGRPKGSNWRDFDATPLPIDNRTVLLLLSSLQLLEHHGGAMLLSYRALDVEQIGHVYEGLLEHTVARVPSVTVGLIGSKNAKNPNITLSELESARLDGEAKLLALLKEKTKRSESAIRNALARSVEDATYGRLLAVCGGDTALADRIRPFANLLRTDAWEDPIVYRENAFMVTLGADRRETGTHYTPKSLTESIVQTTLEPVAYIGPAEGKPREEWRLKSAAELLDLKICDPAMGSGAFLVQACRWLAERLVEAWATEEAAGNFVTIDGDVRDDAGDADPMPADLDERITIAKRLIAERCLYGVDVNPLAVELAKLSIWLVTLAKGRPFGFLDHNLRHGDSLLGIHRLNQLTRLKMNPDDGPFQQRIFGQNIADAVAKAIDIRKRLRSIPIRDIHDVETMARLDMEARKALKAVELVADAMIGEALRSNGNVRVLDLALDSLAVQAGEFLKGNEKIGESIAREARLALSIDLPEGKPPRKPFHWPLEFPEMFVKPRQGFDAVIGNPPWGYALTPTEINYLKKNFPNSNYKLINSFKFFIERITQVTDNKAGVFSFVVPSSLLEHIGCKDTRTILLKRSPLVFVDCGDGMFKGVTQACCYAVISQKPATEDHVITLVRLDKSSSASTSAEERIVRKLFTVTTSDVLARKYNVISAGYEVPGIRKGFVSIKDVADVYDSGIDYSRAKLGKAVFYKAKEPEHHLDHKVLRGRNVDKYSLQFEGIWLRHNWQDIQRQQKKEDAKSRLKVNEKIYLRVPKILVRQTGDKIIATVDTDRYYHQKSLLCICPKKGISAYYLCAVLNHPEVTRIYRQMTMQKGKVFSQVKKNFLEQLPVPSSTDATIADKIVRLCEVAVKKGSGGADRQAEVGELEKLVGELFTHRKAEQDDK
ncbi:Methyltransferase domain-containing protein [Desulfacinum infernum DSM 9756]|uniref:site-specific DNA-methyltransferase (adenine-specific) n=1 Tax=Desulfacinum infernum DSM 9756 TaxID=1121391 RepID=A0A1M5IYM1_9BACT|nr:TaqI-like C-terminal specificity domain-containing protein [Desulfacinum infernum]SHG33070.1 Methyltransferase domain-containing protein [Desulfacinum infernum DSM 9756]